MKTLACGCPSPAQSSRHAGGFGFRCSVNLPGCRMGAHHHPEARIVLPLRFGFDTRFGSRSMAIDDSAALFRPAGEEHEDRYRLPTTCISLLLPMEGPAAASREPFAMRDAALPSLAETLRREMTADDAASPLVMEGLALLVSSKVLNQHPLLGKGMPRWIGVVRERLESQHLKPPTLADLGRLVGRDAAYVAATFKRVYGKSVGTYVRHLRLWQAHRLLTTEPECPSSELAQRCGFADQSHFIRQFKRQFAVTPLAYRQRHDGSLSRAAATRHRDGQGSERAAR
jgi:AraC-like DNA-binding protein